MKAVAIVSGWISCTDETGERRAIPKGTRIRIESRAGGYRVSWRGPTGRRRATRLADHDLHPYRNSALPSFLEATCPTAPPPLWIRPHFTPQHRHPPPPPSPPL